MANAINLMKYHFNSIVCNGGYLSPLVPRSANESIIKLWQLLKLKGNFDNFISNFSMAFGVVHIVFISFVVDDTHWKHQLVSTSYGMFLWRNET